MTGEFRRPGGVSLRTYQRYEYGEREPQFSTSIKLADYYAVSRSTWPPGTKPKQRPNFAVGAGHRPARPWRGPARPGGPRPTGVAPPTGNGRPHGAAPTAFHRGRFVGAGPRPARQVWGTSRDTAGGAHPQGGFSRPSADSPSAPPLRFLQKRFHISRRGDPWASRRDVSPKTAGG